MFLDTKSVKDLRAEAADLRGKVAEAKELASVEEGKLRDAMDHSREQAKYRPSAMASSMGWKPYD